MDVLIVDDCPVFAIALRAILAFATGDDHQVTICTDVSAARLALSERTYGIVLVDPAGNAEALDLIALASPAPIVAITAGGMPGMYHAGFAAVVSKTLWPAEIAEALRQVIQANSLGWPAVKMAGTAEAPVLTQMQKKVFAMLIQGKPNKEIARELNLSVNTIKVHVTKVLRKMNVTSRAQAISISQFFNAGDAETIGRPHPETPNSLRL